MVKIVGVESVKRNQQLQKEQAASVSHTAPAQPYVSRPRIDEEMIGPGGWRVWSDGILVGFECIHARAFFVYCSGTRDHRSVRRASLLWLDGPFEGLCVHVYVRVLHGRGCSNRIVSECRRVSFVGELVVCLFASVV